MRSKIDIALRMGASGLRSSWASVARNSSLRRSASRTWYCRSRARSADLAALIRAIVRTGRSSKVTLPSSSTARCASSESEPSLVSTRIGRSDHGCCRSRHCRRRGATPGICSSTISTPPAPCARLSIRSDPVAQTADSMPAEASTLHASWPSCSLNEWTRIRRSRIHPPPAGAGSGPSGTGTPVSTPRKPRSVSPTWMPVADIEKDRIVRSCRLPRFLKTDTACFTSPSCS